MSVCLCEYLPYISRCLLTSTWGISGAPGTGVTGGYRLPYVGAGAELKSSGTAANALISWTISADSNLIF